MKVLIADDDLEVMDLILATLNGSKTKLEVKTVSSGREAWNAITADPPHLLVLDLKLPEIYGTEICAKLKVSKLSEKTKILVLTSYLTPHVRQMILASGADDCMQKPFDPAEFLKAAEKLLQTV